MKKIVLFDPGIRSLNKGDEIIMNSAQKQLENYKILDDAYVIHAATHSPVVTCYQNTGRNPHMRFYEEADYKFICGSNLLWKNLLKPRPVFNVNLWNSMPYRNSILLGVGMHGPDEKTNLYTRQLYRKILSRDYIHSVRDDRTADFLKTLGYRAINTGCPTMWGFTEEFCAKIPSAKAERVVFTLTDYAKDKEADQKLIDILLQEYREVYFWVQGAFDLDYLDSMVHTEGITIIPPEVSAFSGLLSEDNIEYVGTRLHAGMFALQHQKRTLVVAVDHRMRDMNQSYHIPMVDRRQIGDLPELLREDITTNIGIHSDNIRSWCSQFQ